MAKQQTIARECFFSGIGLHTGNRTTLNFKPAPEDFGIRFIRIDLPNKPEIIANINNVIGVTRGTTIANGNARVHTIEHIMATLNAMGIDNIIIELDNNETPVGDGSAIPFVETLKNAGVICQSKERQYITLENPIKFVKGDTELVILPSDSLEISCTISYEHPILKTQFLHFSLEKDDFIKEIAPARTFCFDYEIEYMKKEGLAKGGNLDNAIVIGEKKVHNKELRFCDEFVRHKILDLIGDIYLLGKPIKGHIIAIKCGHAVNIEFAKEIAKNITISVKKNEIKNISNIEQKKYEGQLLNINDIMNIIPHRYPFLLIDKAILLNDGKSAVGFKNVSINEAFFQGHYPGNPIMPGVLIIEGMAQTSCLIFLSKPGLAATKVPLFMGINEVKFRKSIIPGDMIIFEVEVTRERERGGKLLGKAFVNNNLVAEAEIMFTLVDKI
ncbi:MAG: UDP-3-O-acyl-N-acetylglucosamine deacetylase [Elusimicrobiota bacterium]|jgi:UDP-3-O-[3-hydroxymyristoyl] N-acetylglucosamine deacetylase/3-hydroxyacyl-[acyl-carrier-protein] dehydratase|nr:UDP-3-O-acyl-N-acetylglucosamine deacetylase [Elusimicrobiota bacterium]